MRFLKLGHIMIVLSAAGFLISCQPRVKLPPLIEAAGRQCEGQRPSQYVVEWFGESRDNGLREPLSRSSRFFAYRALAKYEGDLECWAKRGDLVAVSAILHAELAEPCEMYLTPPSLEWLRERQSRVEALLQQQADNEQLCETYRPKDLAWRAAFSFVAECSGMPDLIRLKAIYSMYQEANDPFGPRYDTANAYMAEDPTDRDYQVRFGYIKFAKVRKCQ